MHALHTTRSIFAGMLMFTEREVDKVRKLAKSELELKDLKSSLQLLPRWRPHQRVQSRIGHVCP